jgi:hypothetical protein
LSPEPVSNLAITQPFGRRLNRGASPGAQDASLRFLISRKPYIQPKLWILVVLDSVWIHERLSNSRYIFHVHISIP